MKKVMVFGTFDGLHAGHLNFFEQARARGDVLTVVLARDKNVVKIKGRKPRQSELRRLRALKKAVLGAKIRLGQVRDPFNVIRQEKPDIICLGYDQNSFVRDLKNNFPRIKICRLNAYKPHIYKSSKINNKEYARHQ